MRKLYFFILILFEFGIAFPQQQQLYFVSEVKEMAVFPGCEKIKPSRFKEMNECFTSRITELLNDKMDGMDDIMFRSGTNKALAIIRFVVTKEGVMLNFSETNDSNPILAQYTINTLNQISEEIDPIKPARLKNGSAVNLLYQMPVTWEADVEKIEETAFKFPTDEIVLFTLKDSDATYEIRLFKEKDIKVYEIGNEKPIYLGRFLSMSELKKSDPYKTLIENESKAVRTLLTKGLLNNENYEIYIHNLFRKNKKDNPIFVEIEKVKGDKRTSVHIFDKEIEFNKSKYAPLIYR